MPEIINILPSLVDSPPSTAQIIADEILQMSKDASATIVGLHQQPFNKLWARTVELGVHPQEVLDILGENGPVLFERAYELVQFITGAYGNLPIATMNPSEYLPPYSYTIQNNIITLKSN